MKMLLPNLFESNCIFLSAYASLASDSPAALAWLSACQQRCGAFAFQVDSPDGDYILTIGLGGGLRGSHCHIALVTDKFVKKHDFQTPQLSDPDEIDGLLTPLYGEEFTVRIQAEQVVPMSDAPQLVKLLSTLSVPSSDGKLLMCLIAGKIALTGWSMKEFSWELLDENSVGLKFEHNIKLTMGDSYLVECWKEIHSGLAAVMGGVNHVA